MMKLYLIHSVNSECFFHRCSIISIKCKKKRSGHFCFVGSLEVWVCLQHEEGERQNYTLVILVHTNTCNLLFLSHLFHTQSYPSIPNKVWDNVTASSRRILPLWKERRDDAVRGVNEEICSSDEAGGRTQWGWRPDIIPFLWTWGGGTSVILWYTHKSTYNIFTQSTTNL